MSSIDQFNLNWFINDIYRKLSNFNLVISQNGILQDRLKYEDYIYYAKMSKPDLTPINEFERYSSSCLTQTLEHIISESNSCSEFINLNYGNLRVIVSHITQDIYGINIKAIQ